MPRDPTRGNAGPSNVIRIADVLPDVRDGLTRVERVILWQLREAARDFPGRNVPTATLYGRVVEHVDISLQAFVRILARMGARAPR